MAKAKIKQFEMAPELEKIIAGASANFASIRKYAQPRYRGDNQVYSAKLGNDQKVFSDQGTPEGIVASAASFTGELGNMFDVRLPEDQWGLYCDTYYNVLESGARVLALDYVAGMSDVEEFKHESTKGYVGLFHLQQSLTELLEKGQLTDKDKQQVFGYFAQPTGEQDKDGNPQMAVDQRIVAMENHMQGGIDSRSMRALLDMKGRVYAIQREAILNGKYRNVIEKDLVTGYQPGSAGLLRATAMRNAYGIVQKIKEQEAAKAAKTK
jgi:hypothetical protein